MTLKMEIKNQYDLLDQETHLEMNTDDCSCTTKDNQEVFAPVWNSTGWDRNLSRVCHTRKPIRSASKPGGKRTALKTTVRSSKLIYRPSSIISPIVSDSHQNKVMRDTTTQAIERPYKVGYFLPLKLEGRPAQFLIDIRCATNLLSKKIFDQLPMRMKELLEKSQSHGLLADRTQLPLSRVIRQPFCVRDLKAEEAFVVSWISEGAILGMPFLVIHDWTLSGPHRK